MIIGALQTRLEEHHESNILHRRHRVSGQKSFGRVDAGNHPPFTFSLSVYTRHWIDQALKTHARLRRLGEDEYVSTYSPIVSPLPFFHFPHSVPVFVRGRCLATFRPPAGHSLATRWSLAGRCLAVCWSAIKSQSPPRLGCSWPFFATFLSGSHSCPDTQSSLFQ